ncbi:hypothetical protein BJ322DRAFT_1086264 [Thelephora terrestris]|uniref:Uncharacterized protein n=1 Tax=Thelephora terrestris TaxID=56493 RepID=A0A9P6L1Z7_9AGAM|nr:hypothetical protein BJ322DRAFT_1086264 [Thelephora terrestris]
MTVSVTSLPWLAMTTKVTPWSGVSKNLLFLKTSCWTLSLIQRMNALTLMTGITEGDEVGQQAKEDGGQARLNHWFNGVELGIIPPTPTRAAGYQSPQRYRAGCEWTSADWSCSYDAIFMSFWTIYEQSYVGWRDVWTRHSPDWNTPLGNNFDHLILLTDTLVNARDHAVWFSRYRDRFRDQLSRTDPRMFPRRGPVSASASRILQVIFGQDAGLCLEQRLVCSGCGISARAERETYLLAAGSGLDRKIPISLHTVWDNFIQRCQTDPFHQNSRCSRCQGQNKVRCLEMPDVPWIWFEREKSSPVGPSLALTFDSPSQRLSYSLRSIIYAGQNHFTIRFCEQSGKWWRHDGQIASGVPQPDNIQSESQLLMSGARFACIFIYRRDA